MRIESKEVQISKSPAEFFELMSDLKNMKLVMPASVERFESDAETFVFGLKGMPDVRLLIDEVNPPGLLKFKAASSKLDFTLSTILEENEAGAKVKYLFEGNFNPMMKMMVERPLTRFIEDLSASTAEL
ncbi:MULTISPECIES: SRPBCC family protein [Croceimicrobium]|uniref:SRPBCC family protein n=1 Tax=Croceimicrobium hydrocarbonivorans TaxID=2761580 RepID=A0A7H0VGT6_9FLAO|nr:SRPBCC family protein [Croceimicrobium hydrocarbonivorans]QNR24934.1 SRPBCC family protein [Croceimicrobium hydrocarbonivorans]